MTVELGIVVPLLELNPSLDKFLEELALVLIKNSINAEVVIIASKDTFHLPEEQYENLHKKFLMNLKCLTMQTQKNGYGRIFRIGIANLDARYVGLITPDDSNDSSLIPILLNECRAGSTLTIVNRFGGVSNSHKANRKKLIQNIFRSIAGSLIGKKLPMDSTFTYRMFLKSHYEYLAVSGNSWDMLAEQTIKTLLSEEVVKNVGGTYVVPNTEVRFSYLGNFWSYCRVLIRGSMHRFGFPWY
jgi:hypothetical protein